MARLRVAFRTCVSFLLILNLVLASDLAPLSLSAGTISNLPKVVQQIQSLPGTITSLNGLVDDLRSDFDDKCGGVPRMIQSLGNNVQEVGPNLVQALMSLGDIDIDVSAIQPGEKKKSKTVLPFFPSAADSLSLSLSLSFSLQELPHGNTPSTTAPWTCLAMKAWTHGALMCLSQNPWGTWNFLRRIQNSQGAPGM